MRVVEKHLKKAQQKKDDEKDEAVLVNKSKLYIFFDCLRARGVDIRAYFLPLQIEVHFILQIYQCAHFLNSL